MTVPIDTAPPLLRAVPESAAAPSAWSHLTYYELRTALAALKGHLAMLSDRAADLPPEVSWSVAGLEHAAGQLEKAVFTTCGLIESLDRVRD